RQMARSSCLTPHAVVGPRRRSRQWTVSLRLFVIDRLNPNPLPKRHLDWVILCFVLRGKTSSEDKNLALMGLSLHGVFHVLNSPNRSRDSGLAECRKSRFPGHDNLYAFLQFAPS